MIIPATRNKTQLLKRSFFLLIIVFSFSGSVKAQDDTTVTDMEVLSDTSDVPNYFNYKNSEKEETPQWRMLPSKLVDSLKKDKAFWYADSSFQSEGEKVRSGNSNGSSNNNDEERVYQRTSGSKWLNTTTLTIILVVFILAIIFLLIKSNVTGRKRYAEQAEETIEETENIFEINYQKEIEKAIREQNFRLAIRLMYLRLLKNLSEKNIIQYKPDRTNFEYLSQLSATKYYTPFFRLTRNYEYAWYGKLEVKPEAFQIIRNEFENFEQNLK